MVSTRRMANASKHTVLAGYRFVISGKFQQYSHKQIEEEICQRGGKITKTIGSDTYLLSTPDASGSGNTKVDKAKELGRPIIDFLEWINRGKFDPDGMRSCYLWEPSSNNNYKPTDGVQPKSALHWKSTNNARARSNGPDGRLRDSRVVTFNVDGGFNRTLPGEMVSNPTRQLMAPMLDIDETSLKQLNGANIKKGFELLRIIKDSIIESENSVRNVEMTSSKYHTVIPHRRRYKDRLLNDKEKVEEEETWLREASVILKAVAYNSHTHQGPRLKQVTVLDRKGPEFDYLTRYLNAGINATHEWTYHVANIFRVEHGDERERFREHISSLIEEDERLNRRLLWHGSPLGKCNRILSQGLELEQVEIPLLGHTFGDGIHLFETALQAASHCDHKEYGGVALLYLCEAALGNPVNNVTTASDSNANDTELNTTRYKGRKAFPRFINGGLKHKDLQGVRVPDLIREPKVTNKDALLEFPHIICRNPAQVTLHYVLYVNVSKKGNQCSS